MGPAEWALLVFLSILWGGSFFFIEVALTGFSAFAVVALRVSIAALLIWLFVLFKRYPLPIQAGVWVSFLVMGIINNAIPFFLIAWAQEDITGGLASILNAAAPIFTVIVAGVLLRDEPMTGGRIAGAIIGLAGVAILIGPDALTGSFESLLAPLAVLGAALAYSFASVFGRRFARLGVNPFVAAAGQLLASSLVMFAISVVFAKPISHPDASLLAWAAIIGLAVLSTALAYVIYFRILQSAGATNLILVTLLLPITAILLGTTLLDETLLPAHVLGMLVIAAGLAVIDGRIYKRFAHSSDRDNQ